MLDREDSIRYARRGDSDSGDAVHSRATHYNTKLYIGLTDGTVTDRDLFRTITVFGAGKYFDLNDVYGKEAEPYDLSIPTYSLDNVMLTEVKKPEEIPAEGILIGAKASTNIYVGSGDVLAAYVSSRNNTFRSYEALTKLGMKPTDELESRIRKESRDKVVSVYNLFTEAYTRQRDTRY